MKAYIVEHPVEGLMEHTLRPAADQALGLVSRTTGHGSEKLESLKFRVREGEFRVRGAKNREKNSG